MRFRRRMEEGKFALALEILPPQRPLPKVLLRRAMLLGDTVQAVNVIQRPGRQSSLEASLRLQEAGIEPAWHLVTRGRSRAEVVTDLRAAAEGGIGQVLCILGDHAAEESAEPINIRDAIALACETLGSGIVGATLNQYGRDPDAVLRNLFPKLQAGASYVQTQPVFEASSVEPYARAIDGQHSETRVIAMAMPLLTPEAGRKIEQRTGVELPTALREVLASRNEALAWAAFQATVEELVEAPYIDGVAIMTFEGDASPETGARIGEVLRAAGATDREVPA